MKNPPFLPGLTAQAYHYMCNSTMSDGRGAINHTQLRLGLSGLNGHRCFFNFIDYATCPKCGHTPEDSEHFLLLCPVYAAQRETLLSHLDTMYNNELNRHHRNLSTPRNRLLCLNCYYWATH